MCVRTLRGATALVVFFAVVSLTAVVPPVAVAVVRVAAVTVIFIFVVILSHLSANNLRVDDVSAEKGKKSTDQRRERRER